MLPGNPPEPIFQITLVRNRRRDPLLLLHSRPCLAEFQTTDGKGDSNEEENDDTRNFDRQRGDDTADHQLPGSRNAESGVSGSDPEFLVLRTVVLAGRQPSLLALPRPDVLMS
jgi:hypothetical protein